MDWGKTLVEAGANYAIWRPEDWESGRIEAELVAIAGGIAGRSSAGQARPVSQARGLATA